MRRLLRWLVVLALATAPLPVQAQAGAPDELPIRPFSARERALLGCYAVALGAWHNTETGAPSGGAYVTPPDFVVFDTVQGWSGPDSIPPYRLLLVGAGSRPWAHGRVPRLQYWQVQPGTDTVRLGFSTYFSGVRLVVAGSRQDSLIGTAHDFWDFTTSHQVAPVVLRPTTCAGVRQR